MTRYFYTDPFAAAWMAKHHGMRFLHYGTNNECDILALFAAGVFRFQIIKLEIHPSSLPLLEPQKGDKGRDADDTPVVAHRDGEWSFEYGAVEEAYGRDDVDFPIKITQRNGLAFMWPESEGE